MKYPILVSPKSNLEVIVEFTSMCTGRIIRAAERQVIGSGYRSTIGTVFNTWAKCNDEDLSYKYGSWQLASEEILKTIPYVADKYPELLI